MSCERIGKNLAIGLKKETEYGVAASPPEYWLPAKMEGNAESGPELITSEAANFTPGMTRVSKGKDVTTTTISVEFSLEHAPVIMSAAMGGTISSAGSGPYQHSVLFNNTRNKYGNCQYLDAFTIEENNDGIAQRFLGAKIQGLKLSAAAIGDIVSAEMTFLCKKSEEMTTPSTIVLPDVNHIVFLGGYVYESGDHTPNVSLDAPAGATVLSEVKGFVLEINNTFSQPYTIYSGEYVHRLTRISYENKITMTQAFTDYETYNKFKNVDLRHIWLKFMSTSGMMAIDIPKIYYDKITNPRGSDELVQDMPGIILVPSVNMPQNTIGTVIENSVASY